MSDLDLERRAEEVQERYGHLLTKEVALSLASSGHQGGPPKLKARVLRIFSPYAFEKRGRKGRVCRAELELLPSNERRVLVLWDSDVDLLLNGRIRVGDVLAISGYYEKDKELHTGRQGNVEVLEGEGAKAEAQAKSRTRPRKAAVIRELRASDDVLEAIVDLDGREESLKLRGKRALSVLGIRQPHEGISLKTIVGLKRSRLVGTTVAL